MTSEKRKQHAWPSRQREKLDAAAVSEIRRRRSEEGASVKQLANEFPVSEAAIFDLLKGKTWKGV